MAKSEKIARELQVGDRVMLRAPYGDYAVGDKAIIRHFRLSSQGPQAYVDIGNDGIWLFTSDLALEDE